MKYYTYLIFPALREEVDSLSIAALFVLPADAETELFLRLLEASFSVELLPRPLSISTGAGLGLVP